MTIALGVLCKDGAVLAADSQETLQGYWKRRQAKVMATSFGAREDFTIAMAGAGRAGYIDAEIEQLIDALREGDGKWHLTIKAMRTALIRFHRDHVAPYPVDPPECPLIIAMQKGRHLPALFTTDRSTVREVADDVAAVGIGAGHALAILERVQPHRIPLDSAIALAAYVVHHTKNHVADCGDVTNIVAMRNGRGVMIPREAIDAMDAEFKAHLEEAEPSVVRMLVGISPIKGAGIARQINRAKRAVMNAARQRLVGSGVEIVIGSVPQDDE